MNGTNEKNVEDDSRPSIPQVKVCGLTRVDEALSCAGLGASAIGCVFYARSPRNVSEEQARDICAALPTGICRVGVFVDEDFSFIMRKVERCGLTAVQLHGVEPPSLVVELAKEGLIVIKGLYANAAPALDAAESYGASAYLVEHGGGALPGGNAMAWDWSMIADFSRNYPTVLAGGLTPDNVSSAISAAAPDAVDVSSGVEASPGRKDTEKAARFFEAVFRSKASKEYRKVFK